MAVSPKVRFRRIIRMYAFTLALIIIMTIVAIFYVTQNGALMKNLTFHQLLWVVSLLFLLVVPLGLNTYKRHIVKVNFGDPLSKKLRRFKNGFYGQMFLILLGVIVNTGVMIFTGKLVIALQLVLLAGAATMSFPSLPRMQTDLKLGKHDIEQLQK